MKKIILIIFILAIPLVCFGQKENISTREEFYSYYNQLFEYRKDPKVMVSSNPSVYNDCEAFRNIVKGGNKFLPYIIEEMNNGDFFLNQAMEEITGFDIGKTKGTISIIGEQVVSKLWIEWWREHKDEYLEKPIKLTISSDKETYEVGDEVWINFTFKNVSNKPIDVLIFESEYPLYHDFEFLDTDGKKIGYIRQEIDSIKRSTREEKIASGGEYTTKVPLHKWKLGTLNNGVYNNVGSEARKIQVKGVYFIPDGINFVVKEGENIFFGWLISNIITIEVKDKNWDDFVRMSIYTPSGWVLDINKDGSGSIGFGAEAPGDVADFPKETFNFIELTQMIEPKLKSEGTISTMFGVSFQRKGQVSTTARCISDILLMKQLFEKAYKASDKTYTRIEKLYKEKPPVE